MVELVPAIEMLGSWFDRLAGRQDRADVAVKAVLLALNETKAYIVDWKSGNRSRERERLLTRLWTEAAVAIRKKDRDFAHQLQAKAEYWTDPDRWTANDVERAGIKIDVVAAKARSLLGGAI